MTVVNTTLSMCHLLRHSKALSSSGLRSSVMIRNRQLIAMALFVLAFTAVCCPVGIPHLDFRELVKSSDVIGVFEVTEPVLVSSSEIIYFHNQLLTARRFS